MLSVIKTVRSVNKSFIFSHPLAIYVGVTSSHIHTISPPKRIFYPCTLQKIPLHHVHKIHSQASEIYEEATDLGILKKRACDGYPEAQFQFGSIFYHIMQTVEDDSFDFDGILKDTEEDLRSNMKANEKLKTIKDIRLHARKKYKETMKNKKSKVDDGANQGDAYITRTSKSTLDSAFGRSVEVILNPNIDFHPSELEKDDYPSDVYGALAWIRKSANNHHGEALVFLGNICREKGSEYIKSALTWYEKSSNMDPPHPDGMYNLGLMYYEGIKDTHIKQNRQLALEYFKKAAQLGDASAMFWLGHLHRVGSEEDGIQQSPQRAKQLIESAASDGHSGAQYYLATLYYGGDPESGFDTNKELFWKYLHDAADNEYPDAEALFCLGDIYFCGIDGKEQNYEKAFYYFRNAGKLGHGQSLFSLGVMYYHGKYVQKSYEHAFKYYQAAAELDFVPAWKNLAEMYMLGHGTPKNEKTANSILSMLRKMEETK